MHSVFQYVRISQVKRLQNGLIALRLDSQLQILFLRSPAQLPLPERERNACHQHSGRSQQPKPGLRRKFGHQQIINRMTYLVAIAFLAIIASLATALFFMMKDGTNGKAKTSGMARALAFRIGFSVLLFICILIAWKMGYIQPTGLPVGK